MKPLQLPPTSGRFVKGRSGNPLGRPRRNFNEKELILLAAKFLEILARAYCKQGNTVLQVRKIKEILYEKKVLPSKKF